VSPRRILLFLTDLEFGGTPTVVRELALRLRGSAEVQVACLGKPGPVADQLATAGVTVTALAAAGSADLRVLPRFVHLVREQRFDTVFSFLIHANAVAAASSLFLRDVRWIQSVQTTQPWPRWHWMIQRLAHRAADKIVVPSPSAAAAAHEWAGVPAEKMIIIPNAIDPAAFAIQEPVDNRRAFPIVFLGRLDPVKDIPTLIDAVALLNESVHLHIFGEGSDRQRIERRIADRNLSSLVTLHGQVDRPQTALVGAGMLVLSSLAEGFGLVLIEAMAAKVPVIATDVPGIRDVVRPEQTGLLVPPSNPPLLAAAIRRLVEDRNLRQRLINNAAEEVRQRWTWSAVLPQYFRLLNLSGSQ
jgi:glycosyltransferase involved in cell wall biosynthesis